MKNNIRTMIVKRMLLMIPVLWAVATLTFVIMKFTPGGPFDSEKTLPPAIKANLDAKYGLDLPAWKQYLRYMKMISTGDLGPSMKYRSRKINDIIADTFPVSIKLGLWAFLFTIVVGVSAGTVAGLKPGGFGDKSGMLIATLGISTPSFVLATMLVLFFALKLGAFPAGLWERPSNVVLPAIALGFGPAAYIARLVRSSVMETSNAQFVTAARARGIKGSALLWKYIIVGALPPVITVLGPLLAALITGSFVIEYIFAIPGMGKYFITSVTDRDYPLIMGTALVYSALVVVANLVVDLLYTKLDPRVEVQ